MFRVYEATRRLRYGIAALSLAATASLVSMGPAWSTAGGDETAEVTTEEGHASEQSHISECVIEAVENGTEAEDCVKAPNPIVPVTNEIVWGSLSFVILFVLLAKKGYPAIKKGMDARTERIQSSIDAADGAKSEAGIILAQYQRQLADAKSESARIIDEARQTADKLRQDLKRQAETEVAEVRQRAQADIEAQVGRAMADLQARVATLSIELAERVVERSLDRDTNMALIERFIEQTGARN